MPQQPSDNHKQTISDDHTAAVHCGAAAAAVAWTCLLLLPSPDVMQHSAEPTDGLL
jgi:hypothetical protein